jgi:glycosyltransferase involved in cell wall biosynthesis
LPNESVIKILIASTQYLSLRTSAAVQVRDLAKEMIRQGHDVLMLTPLEGINIRLPIVQEIDGVNILRLSSFRISNVGNIRRFFGEALMPYLMYSDFKRTKYSRLEWDIIVWYSPSIFLGILIAKLKSAMKKKCPTYLILRDIFPEWALHTGIIKNGVVYGFLKKIAAFQYCQATVIGIQSPSNIDFLIPYGISKIEVLENWLSVEKNEACDINISKTSLFGRKIIAYIGNMGVAQNLDALLEVAYNLKSRADIGFLFVGRGSEMLRLKKVAKDKNLNNTLFFDVIPSSQLSELLAQCTVGIVSLNPLHKTHNIPGKFLTYMREGLPVFAHINPNSDLEKLILEYRVGNVYTGTSVQHFKKSIETMLADDKTVQKMSKNSLALYQEKFSTKIAVKQIIKSMQSSLNKINDLKSIK